LKDLFNISKRPGKRALEFCGNSPGRTSLLPRSPEHAALIVGFQFWGERADTTSRSHLAGTSTEALPDVVLRTTTASNRIERAPLSHAFASQGQWGFLSNNLPSLKDAIDRAAGRKKEGSLADSARYKEVLSKVAKDADLLLFCQPQSALETLLEVGSSLGAQPIPQQVEQLRKVEAIGATTTLDEANLRDRIFVLRRNPPDSVAQPQCPDLPRKRWLTSSS
jgi:hypothetical protein